jgi:ribose-phosphate pyrophosphokinase
MSIRVNFAGGVAEQVVFETYPDGTFYTKFRPHSGDEVESVYFQGTTVNELMQALFLVDGLEARGIDVPEFQIPFIPGGRQDRPNSEGDFLITLASVADLINQYRFERVVTSDPHSEVTTDNIDNLWINTEIDFYTLFNGKYAGVIAPDKGAEERATMVAHALDVPIYFAGKTRDVETGRLSGFTFPEVPAGKRYLVVDDICDGGGTFIGLARAAPQNVFLDLYVTHGLFTKGPDDLTFVFGSVFCRFVYGDRPKGVRILGNTY